MHKPDGKHSALFVTPPLLFLLILSGFTHYPLVSSGNVKEDLLKQATSPGFRTVSNEYLADAILGMIIGAILALVFFGFFYYIPFTRRMKKQGDADLPRHAFTISIILCLCVGIIFFALTPLIWG